MNPGEDGRRPAKEQSDQTSDEKHDIPQRYISAANTQLNQWTVLRVSSRLALIRQHVNAREQNENQNQEQTDYEYEIWIMVVNANTVIEPRAMMVESLNTTIANGAMFASLGSNHLAVRAHFACMHLFEDVYERHFRS